MRTASQMICVVLISVIELFLTGLGTASATQDPASGLLVRLQFTINELGVKFFYEDLYYRDGLVIRRSVVDGTASYARGTLGPEGLAKLRRILNENHVGVVVSPPGCLVPSPFPDFASLEDGSLTWFGKNGRQSYLTVNSGGDDYCPLPTTNLFLETYALPIDFRDTVSTVP
jgi:hypothetical protein